MLNAMLHVLVLATAVLGLGILYLKIRYRDYIKHICQSGNLEEPTPEGLAWRNRLAGFYAWWHVGKITMIGKEKLDKLPNSSYIVTPNHGSMNDIVVLPMVMRGKNERYLATDKMFTLAGGIGGLILGKMGVIPVIIQKGKGSAARAASIELLCRGGTLVLWPEGYSYCDGSMGAFKKGAVLIAAEASKRLGQTTYVVPVYIRYGSYPGPWIRKLPIELQYVLSFLLAPLYRHGCTVVIGDPIASNRLPVDADGAVAEKATYMLRCAICKLDPAGLADPDAAPAIH